MLQADTRHVAEALSCNQAIASGGAFTAAMLSPLPSILEKEGSFGWRRVYWESGIIGQILYLESQAEGLRGTGIGCFFDQDTLNWIGLDGSYRDIYHFTLGGSFWDRRIETLDPYTY